MRRAFSLIEVMAAVLIGSLVMLMLAGGLTTAIRSWTRVQEVVGTNYERRTVLDLVKRQSSSLFFKKDAEELTQTPRFSDNNARRGNNSRNTQNRNNMNRGNNRNQQGGNNPFQLPAGTYFFKGGLQELSFISTVSFLSDFPGQVGVRYFLTQGEDGEPISIADEPEVPVINENGETVYEPVEEIEGDLYLYLEEKNLFLTATYENSDLDPSAATGFPTTPMVPSNTNTDRDEDEGEEQASEIVGLNTMKLFGPLRKFTIKYRKPAQRRAQEVDDEEEDWAERWHVDIEGRYPSAIEFVLFYEEPGITDDLDTEDLKGVRMVIPIYDTNNLARGAQNGPF